MLKRSVIGPTGESGFSLIETMIALMLATFGLLAASQLLFTATSSGSLARSKATAVFAAADSMETLSSLYSRTPSHADLAPGNHGPRYISISNPLDKSVLNKYRITWSISRVHDPRPGKILNAILVKITVTPVQSGGTTNYSPQFNRVLQLSTIFSPGLS